MKKILFFLTLSLIVTGCGTMITVPIDQTLIEEDKATVIVFHEQGLTNKFPIYFDKEHVGDVTSEKPLKLSVIAGEHEMYTKVAVVIDRVTKKVYEAGEVYYMRLWFDQGVWVSSIRIDPTYERLSYEVNSHQPEQTEYVHSQVKLDSPPLKPYTKSLNTSNKPLATKTIAPTIDPEPNKLNAPCIQRMKNTSDYSNSMKEIIENNQGSKYEEQINILNKKIEMACSEYDY